MFLSCFPSFNKHNIIFSISSFALTCAWLIVLVLHDEREQPGKTFQVESFDTRQTSAHRKRDGVSIELPWQPQDRAALLADSRVPFNWHAQGVSRVPGKGASCEPRPNGRLTRVKGASRVPHSFDNQCMWIVKTSIVNLAPRHYDTEQDLISPHAVLSQIEDPSARSELAVIQQKKFILASRQKSNLDQNSWISMILNRYFKIWSAKPDCWFVF